MDAQDIAREVHRRRVRVNPNASKSQAMAEGTLFAAYDMTPSLDHFTKDFSCQIPDERDNIVTVIGTERITIRVEPRKVDEFDVIVFARGRGFSDTDILGWLPTNRVRQAPQVKVNLEDFIYEVKEEFLFEMPQDFSFIEPDTNIPRVWSYEHGAWYLPTTGTYLYSKQGADLVGRVDQELAGSSNKADKA